ncbi:hypothetical protein [Tolypothrix sp. VBCCA 56010]|uniref:hypothetical protein n=1 Tax=Tolypothrix sp. VBCCA 56010 TaxID=3137731 RepID=UPI003D7DF2E9
MSGSTFFFYIFLAAKDSASEASPNLTFKDWITIFTSVGIPLGGTIVWISNFHKQQIDALEKQYAASAKNLKDAYDINEKRFNSLIEKQQTEIRQLRFKIQRLQEVYSIKFLDPNKSNTAFELLTINLNHIREQVEDDKIRSILDKLKSYCEDQVGTLLEQREVEKQAEEWLQQEQKTLVQESLNNRLGTKYNADEVFSNQNTLAFSQGINNYINFLIRSMQRGKLLSLESENLPHNQNYQIGEVTIYIDALKYIDKKANHDLSVETAMEVNDMIKTIIDDIEKKNSEK